MPLGGIAGKERRGPHLIRVTVRVPTISPLRSEGRPLPNTGFQGNATALVTRSLLMFAEGRGGQAVWFGVNKATGERIGSVEIPAPMSTAPMTYMHDGVQYIVLPVAAAAGIFPSLVALRLPQP